MLGPKYLTMEAYARVPGRTAWRASRSASMMGRECGGEERMLATVDLPVAIEPVRPIRSMAGSGKTIDGNEISYDMKV